MKVNNRPGFTRRRARYQLLGKGPDDWRAYIELYAPYLPDNGAVISIADQYFLSLGAHGTHMTLLMDKFANTPLTVQRSLTASALITFATDSPVVPRHSEMHTQYEATDIDSFQKQLASAGIRSTKEYFGAIVNAADAASMFVEMSFPFPSLVMRTVSEFGGDYWPYLSWPESSATWRGLTAYWSGLLSISLPSRILNFWRAMEAVTTKLSRYQLFAELHERRVSPVWSRVRTILSSGEIESRSDAASKLRARALGRRDELLEVHGDKAFDWLYWERRGKAAHADKSSLDFEGLATFPDQIADAVLCQYMARVAIEAYWA